MIHALSLLFCLAAGGGPVHADLHPAEADVYFEMGDVGALLKTVDQTPMGRFLADERLKELLSKVMPSPSLRGALLFTLTSAMPEAKPETWLDGLKTVSVSLVALGPGSDTAAPIALQAVADLGTPEQAKALRDLIVAHAPKHEPMTSSVAGVELLHMGAKASEDMWCAAIASRVVVGGSSTKPEDVVARADKKGAAFASSAGLQKQLGALSSSTGTPVLWFVLSHPLREILGKTKSDKNDPGAFLDDIPAEMNPFSAALVARMQLVGDRYVTEMIANDATAAAKKPVDPAWLEPVPSGQMIVYSSAFDGAAAGKELRAMIAKDEQSKAALAALEQKLGYGPEKVLARLGPGFTVYAAPLGGVGLPESHAWIDCDDPAAFASEFEAMVGALGEALPGYAAKTKPYKLKKAGSEEKIEVPITTLTTPPIPIPMISLAPSFAPVGKKLVFALNSMDVKNELKRAYSGEGEPIVAGANPLTALGFKLPAEARSVFVMDWAKLLGGILKTVKAFAGMAPPDQMPFDLAKLPPPEMFEQYFKPTFHYALPVQGGVFRRNEASFGPETWLGLVGAGAMAAQAQRQAYEAATAPPPSKPAGQ